MNKRMGFCLKLLIYVFLLTDVQSAGQISVLPCRFTDEDVKLNTQGHVDTKDIPRSAVLQFGMKGDPPLVPDTVTFLITPSKLDLRQFLAGAEVEHLSCGLQRYSTDGSHIRWPVKGEHEYNRWYTVTISHSNNLFSIKGFIRQSTDKPPTGQHDYKSWAVIQDKEILTTSVVMVMQTQTPVVKSLLKFRPKLHCQFYIDHKSPQVTVEWRKLHTSAPLFTYNSKQQTQGSGVELKELAAGDATYTTPLTEVDSEGTYLCSVHVHPLLGSLTVTLQIQEPPRVSLNVSPTLTLSEDAVKKVVCSAEGYYPLDVEILWSHKGSTEVGPRVDSSRFTSHTKMADHTYSLSAFFHLQPKLWDSGRKFTCTVYHRTLSAPIKKTFTLIVTEPGQWMLVFNIFLLTVVLFLFLRYIFRVRRCRFFW